jgi:hypothetical protein
LMIHAINITMMKKYIGSGSSNSFIIGAVLVIVRPIRLHKPIAVALLSIGKILGSAKLAMYEMRNPDAVPNLEMKMAQGIRL